MNANMDLRIILRGGFGTLRFGSSIDEIVRILGRPDDTCFSPEMLQAKWPDCAQIEWDYNAINAELVLENTPDRGPCVVTISTWSQRAILLGVNPINLSIIRMKQVLFEAGVKEIGPLDEGNGNALWAFSHGLWFSVYREKIYEVHWTVDEKGSSNVDWSLMERRIG